MFNTFKFTGILIFLVTITLLSIDLLTIYSADSRLDSGMSNAVDNALAINIDPGTLQYGEMASFQEERVRETFLYTLASELGLDNIDATSSFFRYGINVTRLDVEPRRDGTPSIYANIEAPLDTVIMGRILTEGENYTLTADNYDTNFLRFWK